MFPSSKFPEANRKFGPPPDLQESQVHTIAAYVGIVEKGSVEGSPIIIVAYEPNEQELQDIIEGKPIFLSIMGTGLPPHFLSTDFFSATHPA